MDDKMIIETLAQAVRDGKFTIEQIPETFREKVREAVNNG